MQLPPRISNSNALFLRRFLRKLAARATRHGGRLSHGPRCREDVDGARAGIQPYVDAYRTDEPRRMMLAFVNRKKV